MSKIVNAYSKHPLFWDIVISSIVWLVGKHISFFDFQYMNVDRQLSVLSSIIGSCVSLAGFILAALTIIVTFKSNIKSKGMDDATNALDLIFSSKFYIEIIEVFKKAITEYCILFVTLYFIWTSAENLSVETLNRVNVTGILITGIVLLRSLYTLFRIIALPERNV